MVDGLVSIIMPSYNTGRFIAESIDSVIAQTYTNWELIIVDDCSSDNTDEVISNYNDCRIKYFKNEKNSGAALTRNKALREAKGEWIAFLDSDDLWLPEKLEKMIAFMESNHYSFAYHNFQKIDEKSAPLNICVTGPKVVTKRKMYHYGYPGCLTFMYKAQDIGTIQIKDIRKNNDYAILLKVCKKASCFLLDEDLALYRVRGKSIAHDKNNLKIGNYPVRNFYNLFRICDEQPVIKSAWFACWNMWYGFWKKVKYEKSINGEER